MLSPTKKNVTSDIANTSKHLLNESQEEKRVKSPMIKKDSSKDGISVDESEDETESERVMVHNEKLRPKTEDQLNFAIN